jgi:DUF1707 SHOCT-like domain
VTVTESASSHRMADADRERVLRYLGESYAAGRLTAAELTVRSDATVAARTRAELDRLLADLPEPDTTPSGLRDRGLQTNAALFATTGAALVLLWLATRDPSPGPTDAGIGYYWPFWVLFAWAVVLASTVAGCAA